MPKEQGSPGGKKILSAKEVLRSGFCSIFKGENSKRGCL